MDPEAERSSGIGSKEGESELPFHKKPLYFWLKSFADKDIHKECNFSNFIRSNALGNALEYIGVVQENEQSSLHLSAIFDEESTHSLRKYPNHYESEVKSRIQSLNRVFIELKSIFEDNFSQIVAIKPPNAVHISSNCEKCAVQEFEKILMLLLGVAIQGSQKQDTIRKIKRFPPEIQESLIDCIKKNADNPEIVRMKSWSEFTELETEEKQKVYEGLLGLIRRILMERNELIQSQLMSDYFSGYMNCLQKKIYEGKGFGPDSDYDENKSHVLRLLREELHEKSDLLHECREELEIAKGKILHLESELSETQQKLRSCKKVRDEMDALREGQEKSFRLESELQKMKVKLENSEVYYEKFEILQEENKSLQLKHDLLLDQLSFLTIEKSNRIDESTFDFNTSFRSGKGLSFFEASFTDKQSLELDLSSEEVQKTSENEPVPPEPPHVEPEPPKDLKELKATIETQTEELPSPQEVEETKTPEVICNNCNEFLDKNDLEPFEEVENDGKRPKRQRRRSNGLSIKRTRKNNSFRIIGAKLQSLSSASEKFVESIVKSKRYSKRNKPGKTPPEEKKVVPDRGNDADEELSLSPNGPPQNLESDGEEQSSSTSEVELSLNPPPPNDLENDSDLYFICSNTGKSSLPNFAIVSKNPHVENGGPRVPLVQITTRESRGSDSEESELNGLNESDVTIQVKLRGGPPDYENSSHFAEKLKASLLDIKNGREGFDSSEEDERATYWDYGCV